MMFQTSTRRDGKALVVKSLRGTGPNKPVTSRYLTEYLVRNRAGYPFKIPLKSWLLQNKLCQILAYNNAAKCCK